MAQLKCKNCGEPLEPGWDVCPVCETPVAEETKCTNCGKILQPQWATCPYCGTPVNQPLYCSYCHAKLEPGWIVCPACNTPVEKTSGNKQPVEKTTGTPKPNTQCPWCDAEVYAKDKSLVECPHCNKLFFEDERDGHIYQAVKIGKQIWMAENLNYKTRSDSWCYDDDPANCEKYGRLYTWEKAMVVAPKGWHLPGDEEWKQMEMELGMSKAESDLEDVNGTLRGTNEGYKLKSLTGWLDDKNGDNSSGFNAIPVGSYDVEEGFIGDGGFILFWTSSEYKYKKDVVWFRCLKWENERVCRFPGYKTRSCSVRCIKD